MQLLETAPSDTIDRLKALKGTDLLGFFRSLHWNKCLKVILLNQPDEVLVSILESVVDAIPEHLRDTISTGDSKEELMEDILVAYRISVAKKSSAKSIVDDVTRVWASRASDELGRIEIAKALDVVYIKEHNHRQSMPITKALHSLGIVCDEVKTVDGMSTPFLKNKMKASTAVKLLSAFWEANVPITAADGFIGRCYEYEDARRREELKKNLKTEVVDALDLYDVRSLVEFLSVEGDAVSPSNASGRRFLFGLVNQASPTSAGDGGNALAVPEHGSSSAQPVYFPRPPALPATVDPVAEVARGAARVSLAEAPTIRKGENFLVEDALDDDEGCMDTQDAESGSGLTAVAQRYPALPPRMLQLLTEGGPRFELLYEPLRYYISSYKDLEYVLRYFHATERLMWDMCHCSGLTVDPNNCRDRLERTMIFRVRPERRRANNLSFPPTQRRAPFELLRFMAEGSVRQFVEGLASRAGNPAKDNADGYLARQILTSGLVLCSLLDEFHPQVLNFFTAIERLVRHLLVLERALTMEKAERGAFLASKLSFMGIGGGPLPETEELL